MATQNGQGANDANPARADQFYADDNGAKLQKIDTSGSISIPPDLFEKLYLSPETRVKGDLRKTFGNPTPIGLAGFLLCLTPLSCQLMGFRSPAVAAGKGSSDIAVYFFFGGLVMDLAALFELLLGNTFISVVFFVYGTFWFSFGGTLQPFFGAFAAYSSNPTGDPYAGQDAAAFNSSFAFFLLFMSLMSFILTICSIRTNLILFFILWPLIFAFAFISAAFFYTGNGAMAYASTMLTTGGAFAFVTSIFGWYLFAALIFAAIDLPIQLPVFDLSTKIKGYSERIKSKEARTA